MNPLPHPVQHSLQDPQADPADIHWPARFAPSLAPVHVRNTLYIAAPPERVWAWLVREPLWPTWYPNASTRWATHSGERQDLKLGSVFHWRTFGVAVLSQVQEYQPQARIAWDARSMGLDAYHAWLLLPQGAGCRVVTAESQYGWGARLLHFLLPHRMHEGHALWLQCLAIKSQSGMPPEI